ncbi:ribonuclease Z [Clostridium sp. P21]|uniref:Ribonuclease Z n=1 Tax=Clostridium muellerianum TaxID=2716538 RepID=A0A7Y0HNP7_9CLOT|nr:ribonuclease Z [Clostridium muellerianum]NMM62251.1 ribonuclease Z [Clostridium muellerianum]
MIDVCLLGCGGNVPTPDRNLTSLLVSYKGKKILIDCGEGTQVSMKVLGWGFKDISVICFTHYHADHVIGLPGLLLTIANSGRREPLYIVGPEGLREVVKGITVVAPVLPYYVELIELPTNDRSYFEDKIIQICDIELRAQPVYHTMPCLAYSININRSKKFNVEKAKLNNVPLKLWNLLQKGESIKQGGKTYTPDMVLGEDRRGLKLSYCTDTRPTEELVSFVKESDIFVCEGMYGDDEKLSKALENRHMLFSEAASIAKAAKVKELWLTHFSPSLVNPEDYILSATNIFENTFLGKDRKVSTLNFK